jgi:hypothetical protein
VFPPPPELACGLLLLLLPFLLGQGQAVGGWKIQTSALEEHRAAAAVSVEAIPDALLAVRCKS